MLNSWMERRTNHGGTRLIATFLLCGCMALGMPLTASAQPSRQASAPTVSGTRVSEGGEAMAPRKARLLLRQRLETSNRLALDIAALKLQIREQAPRVRDALQQLRKRSDRLTGDQLSTLKELAASIRTHRENVVAQERVVLANRLRMRTARMDGRIAVAAAAAADLIVEQESLLQLLQHSKAAADRLLAIAAQTVE